MPKKLFMDVSSLRVYFKHRSRPSGIQRVTLLVAEAAIRKLGPDAVNLCYYDKSTRIFRSVSCSELSGSILDFDEVRRMLAISAAQDSFLPTLEKYAKKPVKRIFHRTVRNINARLGNKSHFRKKGISLEIWQDAIKRTRKGSLSDRPGHPETQVFSKVAAKDDILLLLDANWGSSGIEKEINKANDNGVKIATLVHDLIPVVMPSVVASQHSFKFIDWLLEASEYSTVFLSNSVQTGDDLRDFLKDHEVDTPVVDVPLAQDGFPAFSDNKLTLESEISDYFSKYPAIEEYLTVSPHVATLVKTPFVLSVGTLEVRKNIWRIAQAWKRMLDHETPHMPKLIFAGQRGWYVDDFFNFMNATGWLGGWVEFIESPSDADLNFLYKRCEFTITASLYEGWGLPIGEGLSFGKTGVVSGISSMPEVGGDMVEYCDPTSIESIAAASTRLITDEGRRSELEDRISATSLRSWDDVTDDALRALGFSVTQ